MVAARPTVQRPPIEDLMTFLDRSPSPFHVVATVAAVLDAEGFESVCALDAFDDHAATQPGGNGYVTRDGSIIAWRIGADADAASPFIGVGAHTDSPNLRITPRPDTDRYGWNQLHVEVYGSILNNSWLDRDLAVAGKVIGDDGATVLLNHRDPIARIPQLAIHLERASNDGLVLNRQEHLRPVWSTGGAPRFVDWLAAETGLDRPVAWELGLYDAQPAALIGFDASMLASGRLDNQVSCWAATVALIAATPTTHTAVIVLNDHEEVGSTSATGADGTWFAHVLERLSLARGASRADHLRALANTVLVSADNTHAIHPNYPDRHEPRHAPHLNAGPTIKLNPQQRYATTADSAARFIAACDAVDVPHQVFVSNNAVPCGSTIGPMTAARLGIDVVDAGIPQLSMHSARELCGTEDPPMFAAVLTNVLTGGSSTGT